MKFLLMSHPTSIDPQPSRASAGRTGERGCQNPSRFHSHPYESHLSKSETRSDVSWIGIASRSDAQRSQSDAKRSQSDAKKAHSDAKVSHRDAKWSHRFGTCGECRIECSRYKPLFGFGIERNLPDIFHREVAFRVAKPGKTPPKTVFEPRYFRLTSIFDESERVELAEGRRTDSRTRQVNP